MHAEPIDAGATSAAPRLADVAAALRGPRRRIVVAMSGGVDSSVVAGLLHAAGHEVIGITLQLYDHGAAIKRKGACCAGQDIHDARRVAAALGIPHYVLDYERRFADAVIATFADSYLAGETPIPCVACNQQIKFRDLLETAGELGAEAMATGHYVERREGPAGPELYRAHDADRDQSYFLHGTSRSQLERLLFPLGGLAKPHVRALAEELGLAIAAKSDSQDICFVPQGRYTAVIERLRPGRSTPGEIVHVDGRVLGRHDGIVNYTIGQRRGLGIASGDALYVVKLDAKTSQVIVGPREALIKRTIGLRDVNWIGDVSLQDAIGAGLDIAVRVRSTQPPKPARLTADRDGAVRVELLAAEHGVAPGQAGVFYVDDAPRARMLGGGTITA